MKFDIITIFPKIFDSYFNESILGRAQKNKLISIKINDLRDYTNDRHRSVDDTPYGGGPGMVMKADIIVKAVSRIKNKESGIKERIILFSPAGKTFTQKDAERYVKKYNRLILIAGRYEGIDERIAKHIADEVVSIGEYVLSGGEIPAVIVVEAVSRLIPGVLGKKESIEQKRLGVGVPQYTRPEVIKIKGKDRRVPKVLLSGDHKKIAAWRKKHKK